jgi:hypothetical protein
MSLKFKQLAMNNDNRLLCLLATSLEFFAASTNPFVKHFSIDSRFPHRSSTELYHCATAAGRAFSMVQI